MASETRLARIEKILRETFGPSELIVTDDSLRHAGHAGSSPSGETHFKVKITSTQFAGLSLVAQHRKVYVALEAELKNGLHALEIESNC